MADKKISELTELTTPDGTEELVVNDSGVSKKVQIDNLLAGGTISNFTSTGIDDNATSTAITIDASEKVGIGTISPTGRLNIAPIGNIGGSGGTMSNAGLRIGTTTASSMYLDTNEVHGSETLNFFSNGTDNSVADYIRFSTGGSAGAERMRVTDNGLTFNGDTVAANALDDYEEGTWTPSISFDGGTTGITYYTTYNKGWYTKVGNVVTVEMSLVLSSKGTSTGQLRVNMPFVSTSGTASVGASVGTHLVNATAPLLYGDFTLGYMVLKSQVASTTVGFSTVTNTECGGAFNLIGNFSYTI